MIAKSLCAAVQVLLLGSCVNPLSAQQGTPDSAGVQPTRVGSALQAGEQLALRPVAYNQPVSTGFVGGCDSGYCCGDPSGFDSAMVFASAEALFLTRNNTSRDQTVILGGASQTLVSTDDFRFDIEGGLRLRVGYQLTDIATIEAGYFGLHEWHEAAGATGSGDLRIPSALGAASMDFLDADLAAVTYESEVHSAELNLVHQFERVELLCGLRFFSLDDFFNIHSFDAGAATASDYSIQAENSLYGGQIGARCYRCYRQLRFCSVVKAGVCAADIEQRTLVRDAGNTVALRDTGATASQAAFVGELGLNMAVPVFKRSHLIAGYNLIWLQGIALAPDQLDFTNTANSSRFVDSNAGVLFHGFNLGLESCW
ncbi:MAG: BBP7 family outer membrane beta-barrel protein [Planctomycetales bacterium]|nr:BBP7 family outer membrane beta-barrel protein [Planctomycetales bacterium]